MAFISEDAEVINVILDKLKDPNSALREAGEEVLNALAIQG